MQYLINECLPGCTYNLMKKKQCAFWQNIHVVNYRTIHTTRPYSIRLLVVRVSGTIVNVFLFNRWCGGARAVTWRVRNAVENSFPTAVGRFLLTNQQKEEATAATNNNLPL